MSEILVGPVQGGPCAGAKEIIAPYSWDGTVGSNKTGTYRWNAFRHMWVWKSFNIKPEKQFVHVKVSESEFQRNAPNNLRRGKQPVSTQDWDLR